VPIEHDTRNSLEKEYRNLTIKGVCQVPILNPYWIEPLCRNHRYSRKRLLALVHGSGMIVEMIGGMIGGFVGGGGSVGGTSVGGTSVGGGLVGGGFVGGGFVFDG
jgi:hypothetical protein